MTPGPKPLPNAIKKLRGSRRVNDNEPKPTIPINSSKPPAYLDDLAKQKWRALAEELEAQGLLTNWDHDTLAAYCEAFSTWRKAIEYLAEDDANYLAKNQQISAWYTIANQSRKEMLRIGGLFGLNPSDRGRLNVNLVSKDGRTEAEVDFGLVANFRR